MNKILLLLLFVTLFSINNFAQNQTVESEYMYQLTFDQNEVSNITEFQDFVGHITASNHLVLDKSGERFTITTSHLLDPKVIKGKLDKFGIEYYELVKL